MSESCNAINDLSNLIIWLCVPNKTEDLNLIVLNIITGINELKSFTKDIYTNGNGNLMKESVIQIKSGITLNINANVKKIKYVKKNMFGIMLHVVAKMVNI